MLIPDEVVQPRVLLEDALLNVSNDEATVDARRLTIRRRLDSVPDYLDIHMVLMRSLAAQRDFSGAQVET